MTMPDEKNIDVDVVDEEKKEDFEDICFLFAERYPYLSELYAEGF